MKWKKALLLFFNLTHPSVPFTLISYPCSTNLIIFPFLSPSFPLSPSFYLPEALIYFYVSFMYGRSDAKVPDTGAGKQNIY